MLKLLGVFYNLEHFTPNDLITKDYVKHKITTNTPKVPIEITTVIMNKQEINIIAKKEPR